MDNGTADNGTADNGTPDVLDQYLAALARYGGCLALALTVTAAVTGDTGWALFLGTCCSMSFAGALILEDNL